MNLEQLISELGVKTNLSLVILTVALLISRIIPVVVLSPFLGGEVVPTEIKIGIGVTLAAVLFPAVSARIGEIPVHAIPYIALLLKEIFVGVAISFVVSMIFEAAQIAGTLVDTFAGTNMAQVMVPQLQQQVSLFASLKLQIAVVLFLTLNGHHMVIEALADSLLILPLDKYPAFSQGSWPFFEFVIRVFADLLKIGLALAAPAFLATFITDLALGMVNRVAPQIQVFFISMSIKPMVAVLIVLVALHLILGRLEAEFGNMLRAVRETIRLLA